MESDIHLQSDNPLRSDVARLIHAHLTAMAPTAPADSRHAFAADRLAGADVIFLTARNGGGELMGCGAVKRLTATHGEIKSMKTHDAFVRQGVASSLLSELTRRAQAAGITRLSLETGAAEYFADARRFYSRHGFEYCAPFGDYREDPHSVFMTLALARAGEC